LDPNILVSALLSRTGAPAQLLRHWLHGSFDLVVSDALLDELDRVFAYPKIRARVTPDDAAAFASGLRRSALLTPDPRDPARISSDRGDDYLIALAATSGAVLVSGDRHLLELADRLPVRSARALLDDLERTPG
jgi:uncharacterized protein